MFILLDYSAITYAGPDIDCVLPGSPQFCEGESDYGSSTATNIKIARPVLHTVVVAWMVFQLDLIKNKNFFGIW